jgi:outer membrane biosynthesis protein TonB
MSMKFIPTSGAKLAALCGITLGATLLTFHARADEWNKKTVFTINQPVQIRDTYLEPGTYVLKLADSNSNRHIVQIFNADQSHILGTVLAIPNYRLQPTGNSRFAFWETPQGSVHALRAWFYPGDNFGQEFPYPKQLRQIAFSRPMEPAPAPEPAPAVAPEPAPVPEPAPAAAPPAVETHPQEAQPEPQPIAENAAPAPPEPAAAQAPAPPPAELPKTGTPYPMIGFGGLLCLGLFSVVRASRPA